MSINPTKKNHLQSDKDHTKSSNHIKSFFAVLGLCTLILSIPSASVLSAEENNPEQNQAVQNKNPGSCPARPQSANLARAMLALTATQNCEDLPYTKEDVEKYIETLKCSPEAKAAIEQLSPPFAAQFQGLFKGPQVVSMCAQAKNFKALK